MDDEADIDRASELQVRYRLLANYTRQPARI